jgi:hypothetical protein
MRVRSDAPLLQRRRLGSGTGRYEFDPLSLITFATPSLAANAEPALADQLAYHRGSAHESHHWLQWIGTTIGAFLASLRFSSEQTALLLPTLDPAVRERIRAERFATPPMPIVGLTAEFGLDHDSGRGAQPVESIVQGWYDHLVTHRLFLESGVTDSIAWDQAEGMAEAVSDLAEVVHRIGASTEYEYRTVRRVFTLPDARQRIVHAGERLTTTGIMEAAATANEILASLGTAVVDADLAAAGAAETADRFAAGSYGVAGKLYADVATRPVPLVPTGLWTFTVVCDIALNPPLPPIVPAGSRQVTWADIYPPYRFRRICAAMRGIRTELSPTSTHEDYVALVDDVCEASGLDRHQSYAPRLCGYQDVGWRAACATESGHDRPDGTFPSKDYSYFDYLLWCFERAWDMRKRDLPMATPSGWQRTTGRGRTLQLLFEDEGAGWFNPPLWAIGDRYGYAQHIKVPFGTWLSASAAIHASTFDLMTGKDNDTLDALPGKLRERIGHTVADNFAQWLG